MLLSYTINKKSMIFIMTREKLTYININKRS